MKLLFDQGTPAPLRHLLPEHVVETAYERGWSTLQNGALLSAAEQENFDALITTDQSMRFQQNMSGRRIAVVVLTSADWRQIQQHVDAVRTALGALAPGGYAEVPI